MTQRARERCRLWNRMRILARLTTCVSNPPSRVKNGWTSSLHVATRSITRLEDWTWIGGRRKTESRPLLALEYCLTRRLDRDRERRKARRVRVARFVVTGARSARWMSARVRTIRRDIPGHVGTHLKGILVGIFVAYRVKNCQHLNRPRLVDEKRGYRPDADGSQLDTACRLNAPRRCRGSPSFRPPQHVQPYRHLAGHSLRSPSITPPTSPLQNSRANCISRS